jgi:hypothetical protein
MCFELGCDFLIEETKSLVLLPETTLHLVVVLTHVLKGFDVEETILERSIFDMSCLPSAILKGHRSKIAR